MLVFKDKFIVRDIPAEYLDENETGRVRFRRLNAGKLAKANEAHTFDQLDDGEGIRGHLTKEARELYDKRSDTALAPRWRERGPKPRGHREA